MGRLVPLLWCEKSTLMRLYWYKDCLLNHYALTFSWIQNENVAIESGQKGLLERNKRFLNYWLTITKVRRFWTLTLYHFFFCISDNHPDLIHDHLLYRLPYLHPLRLFAWSLFRKLRSSVLSSVLIHSILVLIGPELILFRFQNKSQVNFVNKLFDFITLCGFDGIDFVRDPWTLDICDMKEIISRL